MIVSSLVASERSSVELSDVDARAAADVVLLVSADDSGAMVDGPDGGAAAEIVRRLSGGTAAAASHFPLGAQAHTALAAIMADAPARVVAIPLATGPHDPLLAQLGDLLRWAAAWWPDVPVIQSAPVGTVEQVAAWAAGRVDAVLDGRAGDGTSRAMTAVLVVGAGGASPMANAESCAMARLLWERGDYGLVETAFIDDGRRPSVAARIAHCRLLGMRRLVVLPVALLDGAMVSAVRAHVAHVAQVAQVAQVARDGADAGGDGMEVVVAGPLLGPAMAAAIAGERYHDAIARWLEGGDPGLPSPPPAAAAAPTSAADAILPPRYRGGQAVSAAPMRSAPLLYDADGRVAWNSIWQSFCNLALAGGPPHRGSLLEPPLREEVLGDPEGHARVVEEIARGLSLITRLPVVTDGAAGWVGMVCPDEEMAIWLLRAITVENISVRRQGATLFLPAGPRYRVEKEIKNVITAVAKTHHYWTEHRGGR